MSLQRACRIQPPQLSCVIVRISSFAELGILAPTSDFALLMEAELCTDHPSESGVLSTGDRYACRSCVVLTHVGVRVGFVAHDMPACIRIRHITPKFVEGKQAVQNTAPAGLDSKAVPFQMPRSASLPCRLATKAPLGGCL